MQYKIMERINEMSIRIYAITMSNGDVYGVPAEVIADHYAKYYVSLGENYLDNFDTMIGWFDAIDYEFEDWAKNNMDWDDVKDKAFLLEKAEQKVDFQDGWINGRCEYKRYEKEGELHAGSIEDYRTAGII